MTDQIQPSNSINSSQSARKRFWVRTWLLIVGLMVYGMVLVGGATRLTDSGLSITDWRPIAGSLPPLSTERWLELFEMYKGTAEYRFQNAGMSLAEFQQIYWWEWGHRVLGRVIGLVAIIGLVAFWWLKWIDAKLGRRMAYIIGLGALQAVIGMWMVASGIGEETTRVDVAPYRLMIHFTLALLIIAAVYWTWLDAGQPTSYEHKSPVYRRWAYLILALVSIQMAMGALVAGLDAGRTYTDWPLMANEIIPGSYWVDDLGVRNPFENAATAQFNHRLLAYILFALSIFAAVRFHSDRQIGRTTLIVAGFMTLQSIWGVVTLVHVAPLPLALVHQGLGVIVLLSAVRFAWRTTGTN